MSDLTVGVIRELYEGPEGANTMPYAPVVQVLSIKKIVSPNGPDRHRLILSDGQCFAQSMLATQLNHLVDGDENAPIRKHSVLRLVQVACNAVQGRRIIICLDVEAVAHPSTKIGTPEDVTKFIEHNPAAGGAPAQAAAVASTTANASVGAGRGGSNASSTTAAKNVPAAKPAAGARRNGSESVIYPIEGLSPYQNKWTIKARVTVKSDVRHWSNQRGDGKLFSVNLLDETGEIKATGFNEAVDNLYDVFEVGKVYYVSKARVNIAKKQFSNLSNEYEIAFERDTIVELCEDQDAAPQVKYNFVELASLGECPKDSTVDVLGIVKDNGDLSEITAKATNKQIKKRELTIVDRSGYSVRVTLWGRAAETWKDTDNGVFAFKGAKVGDFGGRTLSMGGQSTIAEDPDVEAAHALRGWYDTEGHLNEFTSYNSSMATSGAVTFKKDEFKTLDEVINSGIGMQSEKPEYFATRATITFIKTDNLSYPACPTEKCNKKMTMEDESQWRCEKCNRTYEKPEYRYIVSIAVNDFTNQIWLSGFNEMGLQLFGRTANEMQQLREENEDEFSIVINKALGTMYNFSVKAKADSFNDQVKVRYQLQKAAPVNWVEDAKVLAEQIQAMSV
ncbi:BQ5605_C022g09535 [Microbotryum silenes-dioicae]|uniref:Replication protein A subunit n=1 Tax=Microbotryum silenes-dioicae TaxID=796604 RepID=A0A2X0NDL8_9BASI|nr:BQ5605_C022g09535 [Microbotryum silenes-dioicae]